jgi:hypothetical protein
VERNRLKNRSPVDLSSVSVEKLDTPAFLKHVAEFEAQTKGKRRKDLNPAERQQLDALEKQVVQLTGYLGLAYVGPPETTNCASVDFHDWHLEVFKRLRCISRWAIQRPSSARSSSRPAANFAITSASSGLPDTGGPILSTKRPGTAHKIKSLVTSCGMMSTTDPPTGQRCSRLRQSIPQSMAPTAWEVILSSKSFS